MTLSPKHLQGQLSPPLDTRSATRCPLAGDEIWTHGHVWSRQEPPRRKSSRSSHAALEHLPDYVAGSCGVASPRPPDRRRNPYTGRNCSCTSRLMRCQGLRNNSASEVAFGPIRAQKRACERRAATVARTTRRFAGASTTRSTARVSAGSQGPAGIEETKENHESSCLPRHERCQR